MTAQPPRRHRLMRWLAGVVYIVCLVPGGVLAKLLRHDPMSGKPDPASASYWKTREEHGLSKPMKYPF